MPTPPSPTAALDAFGVAPRVRALVDAVLAQRALTVYDGTATGYVGLHQGGSAPIVLYTHHDRVNIAMERTRAEHLAAVTGARVIDKTTSTYLSVDDEVLRDERHHELVTAAAVEGVDTSARKRGRAPGAATGGHGGQPPLPACTGCWTIPSANGECSC